MKRFLVASAVLLALPVVADQRERAPDADREIQYEWIFGKWHKDPFRWMENRDTPELYTWVRQQNDHTRSALAGPLLDDMKREFQNLYGGEAESAESEDVLMEDIMRNRRSPSAAARAGSKRSPDEKYAVNWMGTDRGDAFVITLKDNATGTMLDDVLLVKFADVIWEKNDTSFLYTSDFDGRHGLAYPGVYRHQVGTSQLEDQLIAEASAPDVWVYLFRVGDQYYLEEAQGIKTKISRLDIATGARTLITGGLQNRFVGFEYGDQEIFAISDDKEHMGEVIAISLTDGSIRTVIPARDVVMDFAVKSGDDVLIAYIKDAAHEVLHHNIATGATKPVSLPGAGRVRFGLDAGQFTISYYSHTSNRSDWSVDLVSGTLTLTNAAAPLPFELESERIYYTAHNGKQVPVWIVRKKGLQATAETPAYLYGYGGFSVNILPAVSKELLPWLSRGGIFAVATLPGGLEYGEAWHRAGAMHNKQNVFTDFAAAAKAMVAAGLTSHSKLAISGVSNGGTLVGSALSLYPQLFKAAVPHVGVMDMTMFQDHTGGKWWKPEYGDAKSRADFNYMLTYSPYHILANKTLPHTLVMTGDMDDRVVPSHSYKFAARLQSMKANHSKALLWTQRNASHSPYSGAKSAVIEGLALKWTFITQALAGQLD